MNLHLLILRMTKKLRYDEEQRHIWRDSLLPVPDDPLKKVEVRIHEQEYFKCLKFLLIISAIVSV